MSTMKPFADTPPVEQQRLLVERILSSVLFRKSHKLATFLRFICEQQQMGKSDTINEQRIGTEVFGRSEGYHMGEDSIVRSQARFLRIRLQEYFTTEGKDELILLTIPKGSYIPEFHYREPKLVELTSPAASASAPQPTFVPELPEVTVPQKPSSSRFWMRVGFGVAVCAALFIGWRFWGARAISARSAVDVRFWSSIFETKRTTVIIPADSSLVLMDELSGNEIQLADYISRKYRTMPPPPGNAKIWALLISSQYTNVVDLNLATRLESMADTAHSKTQIRFARDVSVSELKQNNVILIGSARANPWVDLFQSYGSFRVGYDSQSHTNVVYNRNPAHEESAQYAEVGDDPSHLAYGVVAYLPSLDKEGSALLVGGTSKAGTEAASEFLLSTRFDRFLHTIDSGGAPPHFEILLSTQNLNGNSYEGTIVCYHLLADRSAAH